MKKHRYRFLGMNNVLPPSEVGRPDKNGVFREVVQIVNADPDEKGALSLRPGRNLGLPGIGCHSGWSNGREAYFVEGTALKRFYPPDSSAIVRLGLTPGLAMAFCQVNDVIAYGNGKERGVLETGQDMPAFVPNDPHKEPMVAGSLLAFFNGRLYAARDKVLYCSDSLDVPGGIESMDERFCVVAVFASTIRLLQPVEGGLFVSDSDETFFLSGTDPQAGEFRQRLVAPYPAIQGTAVGVKADQLRIDGLSGLVALWTSEQGICLGTSDGQMINLSEGTVAIDPGRQGAAILRRNKGQAHYLTVMRDPQPTANSF